MTRIFVYGTLKQHERNYDRFMEGLQPVSRNARTAEASFIMREFNSASTTGAFTPVVYKSEDLGAHHIIGEVYDVDEAMLETLDVLERNYGRHLIAIKDEEPAYIYLHRTGEPHEGPPHHIKSDIVTNTQWWQELRV